MLCTNIMLNVGSKWGLEWTGKDDRLEAENRVGRLMNFEGQFGLVHVGKALLQLVDVVQIPAIPDTQPAIESGH